MPFGDHVKVYQLNLPPGEMPARGEKLPRRRVQNLPAADAPSWWSEYLMDEWKRRNGLTGRRDGRTNWQKDLDQWEQQESRRHGAECLFGTRGIPRHSVWEDQ